MQKLFSGCLKDFWEQKMNYQTGIWLYFWVRCSSFLVLLASIPVWMQDDDTKPFIFLPLLVLSLICIMWSFFALPKKFLKYKGYSQHQIQRIKQYFDKLYEAESGYFAYFIGLAIGLTILWLIINNILIKLTIITSSPYMGGIITAISGVSARILSDYRLLNIRQKRKNYF